MNIATALDREVVLKNKSRYNCYFDYLERIRKMGIVNMFGATPYLKNRFHMTEQKATDVLSYWMKNYNELKVERGW